jgi:hypothetical protein
MIRKTTKVLYRYTRDRYDPSKQKILKETWWLFWIIPMYTKETVLSITY